jgi:hypothetical protein
MSPFDVYRCHCAFAAHFQSTYDIFQYGGKLSRKAMTYENFQARKDRYRMEKMAKTMSDTEIKMFFLANHTRRINWKGMFEDENDRIFRSFVAYNEALSHNFEQEFKTLLGLAEANNLCYDDIFISNDESHPLVFNAWVGETLSPETFVILNRLNSFTHAIEEDVLTEDYLRVAKKYDPFLSIDLSKYAAIVSRQLHAH